VSGLLATGQIAARRMRQTGESRCRQARAHCDARVSVSQPRIGRTDVRPSAMTASRQGRRSVGGSAKCPSAMLQSDRRVVPRVACAWQRPFPGSDSRPHAIHNHVRGREAAPQSLRPQAGFARAAEGSLKGFPINVQDGKRLYSSSQGDRRASYDTPETGSTVNGRLWSAGRTTAATAVRRGATGETGP